MREKKESGPMDGARSAAETCSKVILRQIRKGLRGGACVAACDVDTSRKPRFVLIYVRS